MARVSLFGLGLQAKSAVVSSQRRLNLYLQIRPADDGIRLVAIGTPGLTLFCDFGDTPPRGVYGLGNFLYVVHRGTLWQVNNAGIATNVGTLLTTTGRVWFADNGLRIMLVDGAAGYTYTIATNTFAQITDPDYVAANTVTWQDQYFIQDKVSSGRFYISALGDPTTWDALDFANAEASPDNLVRVIADHGEICLFGEFTTEFWGDSGAQDFPYARLGSAVVEWGLASRESLVKFDSSLMFLGRNRMGECQVVLLNGYTPQPVGGQDFLNAINSYPTVLDATAYSYMQDGHAFYQINFPTANKSWLYDNASQAWGELQSDTGRHRGNMATLFLGRNMIADYAVGKIYRLDPLNFTDNSAMIPREIVSRHLISDKYQPIGRLWLDFEEGVGTTTGQGVYPQVMLQISEDRGKTFYAPIMRTVGAIGDYLNRVWFNRLGSAWSWTFKARITDPVKVVIMSDGWMETDGDQG